MTGLIDPVPLGRVFLHKDGPTPDEKPYVAALMERIERDFEAGLLAVYGYFLDESCRRKSYRERIWAADYEIMWSGKPTDTGDYCAVFAVRRGLSNWTGAQTRSKLKDVEDLATPRADWDRLAGLGLAPATAPKEEEAAKAVEAQPDSAGLDRPAAAVARRRGPKPGTIDRYGKSDEALYPEIDRLMKDCQMTLTGATRKLASEGRIEGPNSKPDSLAKRLRDRYRHSHPEMG